MRLSLTMREIEKNLPLLRGQVPIEGIEPTFVPFETDNFRKMLNYLEYDISEMSMSSYLIAKSRKIPITAIPVFPHRRFRHSFIFVGSDSSIKEPRDLIGKRVGVPEYQITALLWIRGFFLHDYDVKPEQIKWFFDREVDRIPIKAPENVSIEKITRAKEELFLEKKLDALMDGKIPEIYLQGNPKITRLFKDFRKVEADYYKRTGLFPIMHTIVIKNSLLDQNPWVAVSLWKALVRSKEVSYRKMKDPRLSNLIWPHHYLDEETALFGKDPWPYNIKDNRKALEALIRYSKEQGMISTEPSVEELFAHNTLDLHEDTQTPYDV